MTTKADLLTMRQCVAEQIAEGAGFWHSCSGCHELDEGAPTGPWSTMFACHLGNGCSECGGIGAVWDNADYSNIVEEMRVVDAEIDREERIESALRRCAAQFEFYASEHAAAGKTEKAATNQRFADIARSALDGGEPFCAENAQKVDREVIAMAIAKSIYGDDFDPFHNPETFDQCEEAAGAILKLVESAAT